VADVGASEGISYDGRSADEIAALLALPLVRLYAEVSSTLDVAHELGQMGAPAGTLVLADAQRAGRGRMGRSWQSEPGSGIWLTLLERPTAGDMLSVISLRIALALAPALEPFAVDPIRLKWPNDIYAGRRKLAGILIEARWRGGRPDWLALGIGINVRAPSGYDGASLAPATNRLDVLAALIPGLRDAMGMTGQLTEAELHAFAARDLAIGAHCDLPARGRVAGIDRGGALLIDTDQGRLAFHGGSLVLADMSTK
jgi:BirA family biotin operon repressor/biotin-[acetyl-CoA-carboxylase] ligase